MKRTRPVTRTGGLHKPTALKVIAGGLPRRINKPNEPRPPLGCEAPDYLPPTARKVWDKMYPKLLAVGLITEDDEYLFANFCIYAGRMIDHPDRFTVNESCQMRLLGCNFGMSPAARAALSTNQEKPDQKKQSTGMR